MMMTIEPLAHDFADNEAHITLCDGLSYLLTESFDTVKFEYIAEQRPRSDCTDTQADLSLRS